MQQIGFSRSFPCTYPSCNKASRIAAVPVRPHPEPIIWRGAILIKVFYYREVKWNEALLYTRNLELVPSINYIWRSEIVLRHIAPRHWVNSAPSLGRYLSLQNVWQVLKKFELTVALRYHWYEVWGFAKSIIILSWPFHGYKSLTNIIINIRQNFTEPFSCQSPYDSGGEEQHCCVLLSTRISTTWYTYVYKALKKK